MACVLVRQRPTGTQRHQVGVSTPERFLPPSRLAPKSYCNTQANGGPLPQPRGTAKGKAKASAGRGGKGGKGTKRKAAAAPTETSLPNGRDQAGDHAAARKSGGGARQKRGRAKERAPDSPLLDEQVGGDCSDLVWDFGGGSCGEVDEQDIVHSAGKVDAALVSCACDECYGSVSIGSVNRCTNHAGTSLSCLTKGLSEPHAAAGEIRGIHPFPGVLSRYLGCEPTHG